ncbi:MAG: M3 family oligoendopeptidase [Kosmotogaceae bacterium]
MVEKIKKKDRKFISRHKDFGDWETVKAELEKLINYEINSTESLEKFLEYYSEFFSVLQEKFAWKYINMTRHANDESKRKAFNEFFSDIYLKAEPYRIKLLKRYLNSPYRKKLDSDRYENFDRVVQRYVEAFSEKNIPYEKKEKKLASQYGSIIGSLTVEYKGEEYTLMQLRKFLQDQDRNVREETWKLTMKKVNSVKDKLEKLFDELKETRVLQAKNAEFDNYRDFIHYKKGRFSYSVDDIFTFHNSVEKIVVPFVKEYNRKRIKELDIDTLRPWDLDVEPSGRKLKPFVTVDEFIDSAINILGKVDGKFGKNFEKMKISGLLDLENRKGKAPGGYNMPLYETGAPFIFMNAAKLPGDVRTILHESGHAMHSFSTADEWLINYKSTPHEAAELASMSMELLTLDHWKDYYSNEEDYKIAKRNELFGTIAFLPWCMTVDAFQQWIYTNPDHNPEERNDYFASLLDRFSIGASWEGLEKYKKIRWMIQQHIFTSPFYYIEYGIAQLGALAVYRNYRKNGKEAIEKYKNFLKLGYSKSLNDLYETAGIRFVFSESYISELVEFVKEELEKLN